MQDQVPVSRAWERKFPEQVVMVTTVSSEGRPNIITLGWAMPTSNEALLCAISIGLTRLSHELLESCRPVACGHGHKERYVPGARGWSRGEGVARRLPRARGRRRTAGPERAIRDVMVLQM